MSLEKKYDKTNLYVMDRELWEWAKYKGRTDGLTISEYIFALIKKAKENVHS